ncbi:hypothetical protein AZI86_16040 [Bdellovibrio bacteriovorus]|uniref:Uncharacterized protein n=1 Tax=Bdellovibrio bacteriovorus TaxID=959 RepID=A0A150WHQ1_BDEBC|nr:DUF5985 family protein [Bdellovibrio bacteriovorus]KYG63212.1 hypothetical protein AZI86_16040 [Bdellovibrio bacteriovorus]
MDKTLFNQFIYGAVMMASLCNGLFFLKFWRKTGDRFFSMFAAAFILLSVERWLLLFIKTANETNTWVFMVRLVAFALIIGAVIDKNKK